MEDIIFVLKAVLMGIVEGLTEFLPVSSTGHLIITQAVTGWPDNEFTRMFSVVIQLGAILAIVILFWPKLRDKIKSFFRWEKEGKEFMLIWVIGCVPAGILGVLFNDFIDNHLFSVPTVAIALFVGAIMMIVMERFFAEKSRVNTLESITPRQAVVVGLFQCLALWPGFSRSASTIMGGWACRFNTALAAEYSFFLAIPIMFGASAYSLRKYSFSAMTATEGVALLVGFLVSFLVAYLVVRSFMRFLRHHKMQGFAFYRILLALALVGLLLSGIIK